MDLKDAIVREVENAKYANHHPVGTAERILRLIEDVKANVSFVLVHRPTKIEISMPVLSVCEEYSEIAFSAQVGSKYDGIAKLPSFENGNDTADEYDVFVIVNGIRYIYDGLFYNANGTETQHNHE